MSKSETLKSFSWLLHMYYQHVATVDSCCFCPNSLCFLSIIQHLRYETLSQKHQLWSQRLLNGKPGSGLGRTTPTWFLPTCKRLTCSCTPRWIPPSRSCTFALLFAWQHKRTVEWKVRRRSIKKSMWKAPDVGKQQPSVEVEAKEQRDGRADEDGFRQHFKTTLSSRGLCWSHDPTCVGTGAPRGQTPASSSSDEALWVKDRD